MLTKYRASNTAVSSLGLGLVGFGVLWASLARPAFLGLLAIALGLVIIFSRNRPQPTPLRWAILILVVMSGVSYFVTADTGTTSRQITQLLVGIAGFYALVNWARQRQQLILASLTLLLGGLLIAIVAPVIVQWDQIGGVPIPNAIYQAFPLLLSDPVHPNIMASLMIMLIPLSLSYLLLSRKDRPWPLASLGGQIFLITAFTLMSIVFVLTKSRGGYAAGVLGILIVLFLSKRRVLPVALTFIALILAVWLITSVEQQGPTVIGDIVDTDTLEFRQQVWQMATWMIRDFAFTGVGMGTFNDVATRLYPFPEVLNPGAHNLSLQVALDLGILGLVAYLSILLLTVFMAYASVSKLDEQGNAALRAMSVGLLAGFISLISHGFIDIGVWSTRVAFLPWLIIGLITAVHIQVRQSL